jgi:catechol 2,3-dioxygenase-like lactoylglutathione lyase family enzyme
MNLSVGGIVIDCADPHSLAEFWTRALGMEIGFDAGGQFVGLVPADRSKPYLGLQKVPEERAGKNRVHLDLRTPDREGEVARLVALGAERGEDHSPPGLEWTVMRDPEGNEFCVCLARG